jgi:DNA-binding SARP family transcriptional activator
MTRLIISLLGSFQVTLGGSPVTDFATDKARALLAFLAVEADRPHRREALAGLLWPDQPQRKANQNLRQAASAKMRHFCSSRGKPSSSTPIAIMSWT